MNGNPWKLLTSAVCLYLWLSAVQQHASAGAEAQVLLCLAVCLNSCSVCRERDLKVCDSSISQFLLTNTAKCRNFHRREGQRLWFVT